MIVGCERRCLPASSARFFPSAIVDDQRHRGLRTRSSGSGAAVGNGLDRQGRSEEGGGVTERDAAPHQLANPSDRHAVSGVLAAGAT